MVVVVDVDVVVVVDALVDVGGDGDGDVHDRGCQPALVIEKRAGELLATSCGSDEASLLKLRCWGFAAGAEFVHVAVAVAAHDHVGVNAHVHVNDNAHVNDHVNDNAHAHVHVNAHAHVNDCRFVTSRPEVERA